MAKGELTSSQTDKQKRRDAIASIVGDVFERVQFPAEKGVLLAVARGVELQAGGGRVMMLGDILENAYQESFTSLPELVACVQNAIETS